MTRNQRTFTPREKRFALTALIAALVVVALMWMVNPRPYLGAYEPGSGFDAPAGVLDASPISLS